jgi:hypothetical protein
MTEKPSEAYLAGYFFGREGRPPERRFDASGDELKAYAEGIADGVRPLAPPRNGARRPSTSVALGSNGRSGSTSKNPQVSNPGALLRLRPGNEFVVAGPAREWRGVAIIDRIQPKPVAPYSNHHAVVVVVVTPHSVAFSEGPEIVRVVIHSSDLHYLIPGLVPGSAFDKNAGLNPGNSFSSWSRSGAPHLPQPMRGETECAKGLREK